MSRFGMPCARCKYEVLVSTLQDSLCPTCHRLTAAETETRTWKDRYIRLAKAAEKLLENSKHAPGCMAHPTGTPCSCGYWDVDEALTAVEEDI